MRKKILKKNLNKMNFFFSDKHARNAEEKKLPNFEIYTYNHVSTCISWNQLIPLVDYNKEGTPPPPQKQNITKLKNILKHLCCKREKKWVNLNYFGVYNKLAIYNFIKFYNLMLSSFYCNHSIILNFDYFSRCKFCLEKRRLFYRVNIF